MSDLFHLPPGVTTRWASPENFAGAKGAAGQTRGGRKGSACFPLPAGESKLLAEVNGQSGTVRRMWFTIDNRQPEMLRGLRLDIWWDGADRPAVSAPLGDFFGHVLGRMATFESALFSSPEGRSFNCCVPMPFRSGMKVQVTNETAHDLGSLYYDINYTLGDAHGDDALYLHAHWRRENPTTALHDFAILPQVRGRGRFLGAHVGVIADQARYFKSWWGEGEVKVYLDGDGELPTLCGTGTEDYIGTGWGQGQYANLYQGCHLADHEAMQYGFYRLHLPDPIWFQQEARVTIQQLGCWDPTTLQQMAAAGRQLDHGGEPVDMQAALAANSYGLFERQDDWSACACFYLDQPSNDLPELAPAAERWAGLG